MLESYITKKSTAAPPTNTTHQPSSWNQAELDYFDPWSDKICARQSEVEIVGKEVHYRSIVLFIKRIEMLVRFKGMTLVKANISNSLRGSALELD